MANEHKFTHTAFLTAILDVSGPIPKFLGLEIYSSAPGSLTLRVGTVAAEIWRATGDSFQEAHDKVVEACRTSPAFQWALPWVEPGYAAHMARFDLFEWVKFRNGGCY